MIYDLKQHVGTLHLEMEEKSNDERMRIKTNQGLSADLAGLQ